MFLTRSVHLWTPKYKTVSVKEEVSCDGCWGFTDFLTDSSASLLSPQVATGKEGLSLASSSCPIAARTTETVRKTGFSKALTTPTIIAWIKCLLCVRDNRHIDTPTPCIASSSHFCLISRQIDLFLNIVDGLLHFFRSLVGFGTWSAGLLFQAAASNCLLRG